MEYLETNQIFLTPNIGANPRRTFSLEDSLKSMDKNQKVFIVGICGGQGGGKTKLAKFVYLSPIKLVIINKTAILELKKVLLNSFVIYTPILKLYNQK